MPEITLNQVSLLIATYKQLQQTIEQKTQELDELKERFRVLSEETIPDTFTELGISTLTLDDGSKVSCKEDVRISIPKENMQEAMAWLDANGFGDMIKTDVKISFPRGSKDRALAVAAQLQGVYNLENVSFSETVAPATLKAWSNHLTDNSIIPENLFNVYRYTKTTVK